MSRDVQSVRQPVPLPRPVPRARVEPTQSEQPAGAVSDAGRAARVDRARERLQSGALDQVATYQATARKMLARMLAGDA